MQPVEIYTSPLCGYCHAAKRLLNEKGVSYIEIDVFSGADISSLERAGKLDALLSGEAATR